MVLVSFLFDITHRLVFQKSGPKLPLEVTTILQKWETGSAPGVVPMSPAEMIARAKQARKEKAARRKAKESQPRRSPQRGLATRVTTAEQESESHVNIPVHSVFAKLIASLNSGMYTIDEHLEMRGRTNHTNRQALIEAILDVLKEDIEQSRAELPPGTIREISAMLHAVPFDDPLEVELGLY